jgi:hypothetical protein
MQWPLDGTEPQPGLGQICFSGQPQNSWLANCSKIALVISSMSVSHSAALHKIGKYGFPSLSCEGVLDVC